MSSETGERKPGSRPFLVTLALIAICFAAFVCLSFPRPRGYRHPPAASDIVHIALALERYRMDLGAYPPDTGFGPDAGDELGTRDPCSLWKHLCNRVYDPRTERLYGPYLEWRPERLKACGDGFQLVDPWGNPYVFTGDHRSVLHNTGSFDFFSTGPDGTTAGNNGIDDDGDGLKDEPDESRLNGSVGDDVNNW